MEKIQRDSNLEIRRNSLEKHLYNWLNESKEELSNIIKISELIYPKNWEEVETFKNNSRDNGTEGLVIKNKKYNLHSRQKERSLVEI